MPTLPNDEHQELRVRLMFPLLQFFELPGLGKVRAGVNVTDRHPEWMYNFRGPDVVRYQLRAGKLKLAGRSDLANPSVLPSSVLPLTFQLKWVTARTFYAAETR